MRGSAPLQFDLFCSGYLPTWLPDETSYSLASRYHRLSGHSTPKTTARLLFGHARRGYQHDLAAGLEHLSAVAKGFLGSAEAIALDHTIAPYYLAFATDSIRAATLRRMAGPEIGSLKYSLGLLTSGLRANHPLRGCAECERQDLRDYGVSYWHLAHQYPTAILCSDHRVPLWYEHSKADGSARFEWLLPDEIPSRCRSTSAIEPDQSHGQSIADRITAMSVQLAMFGRDGSFSHIQMHKTLRHRLDAHGLLTKAGSVRKKLAVNAYLQSAGVLGSLSLLRGLPTAETAASRQLSRLLRLDRSFAHPARYVAVIAWLWPTWSAFWSDYLQASNHPIESARRPADAATVLQDRRSESELTELMSGGVTLSAAAVKVGLSIATAQRVAVRDGMPLKRRPKKLTADRRALLHERATQGRSKHEMATEVALSPQTVMRFINTEPGLRTRWLSARDRRIAEIHRRAWRSAIARSGNDGAARARSLAPAAYAWLYRHDRDWLASSMSSVGRSETKRRAVVDWTNRDVQLHDELLRTSQSFAPGVGLSIGTLCQLVPELRAKLRKLDRLPRTARLVQQLVPTWPGRRHA